jgi:hypothetical protein
VVEEELGEQEQAWSAEREERDQMVRELSDREDVDEVEEQLERRDLTLGAGCRETAILIAAILRPPRVAYW